MFWLRNKKVFFWYALLTKGLNNHLYFFLTLGNLPPSDCQSVESGPEVIKLFSCSTQLSTKFQLLKKIKCQQIKKFLALSLPDVVFIMIINVKMPKIVGILTFMSRINFMLS